MNRDKKSVNKTKILRFIKEAGETSKVEIARELNLSMPTVLQNVKELMAEQLVQEVGEYESTGGRKAKALALNATSGYAAGLDITANHISMVLVSMNGQITAAERKRCRFVNSLDYYKELEEQVGTFLKSTDVDLDRILGIGVSIPGIINHEEKVLVKSHALGLDNVSLKMLEQAMPYPVWFENDANAAIKAELMSGYPDTVYLSLSNTVGGAICMNGTIFPGTNKKAGEFGHMILVPQGRQCYCGKKGCVDAYCSALVLAKHTGGSLEAFMDKVKANEPEAMAVWDEYLEYLAMVISNLRMAYDTDIILGGYVGGFLEPYMLELGKKVVAYNLFDSDVSYLKNCRYKKEASAVGAARYFIDSYE